MSMPSLQELLVQTKLISPPQLEVAERDAEMHHKSLPHTLIDLGFVTDRRFAEWMSEAAKLPLVDPISPDAVADLERYVSRAVAREYEVVPIDVDADAMTIAMINPLDSACMEVLQATTGMKIHPVVGVHGQIKTLVDRFYPADAPSAGAFDPSATMIAASKQSPFEFGTETLLRAQSVPLELDRAEESIGATTSRIVSEAAAPPSPAPSPGEAQLDRIERHLGDLMRAIDGLQRRIEAIDNTLAHIVNRR